MEHRGNRRIPFARLDRLGGTTAALPGICAMGGKHQEILGIGRLVFGRNNLAITGHVTLSVSDVDMEIGIRGRIDVLNGNAQHAQRQTERRHHVVKISTHSHSNPFDKNSCS